MRNHPEIAPCDACCCAPACTRRGQRDIFGARGTTRAGGCSRECSHDGRPRVATRARWPQSSDWRVMLCFAVAGGGGVEVVVVGGGGGDINRGHRTL